MQHVVVLTELDRNLLFETDPPSGVSIQEIVTAGSQRALPQEVGEAISFLITWGGAIAQGMVATWLYDRLSNRQGAVSVDGKRLADEATDERKDHS